MDRSFKICITFKFSDFVVRSLLSAGGPYINDIADSLLSLPRLFADDSSLFYSTSSILDIEGIINHDLQLLAAWTK